jgi:hypothetical protein
LQRGLDEEFKESTAGVRFQRIVDDVVDRGLVLADEILDFPRRRQREELDARRRDNPQIRARRRQPVGEEHGSGFGGAFAKVSRRGSHSRRNTLALREHPPAAGVGDFERPLDLSLIDEDVDVGAIEVDQTCQVRQLVIGSQQLGARPFDDVEGRGKMMHRFRRTPGGHCDIGQPLVSRPSNAGIVAAGCQRLAE